MGIATVGFPEIEVDRPGAYLCLRIIPIVFRRALTDCIGQVGRHLIPEAVLAGQISQLEFAGFAISLANLPEKVLIAWRRPGELAQIDPWASNSNPVPLILISYLADKPTRRVSIQAVGSWTYMRDGEMAAEVSLGREDVIRALGIDVAT